MSRERSLLLRLIGRRPKSNIIAFTVTVLIAVGTMLAANLWWRRGH
jgi:hypothetical protein